MRAALLAAGLLCAATLHAAAETYVSAALDDTGRLRIVTSAGRRISPKVGRDQVGFDSPQVSPDGRAVGWLAEYPNCCTSYPIPLKLVLLSGGRTRVFTGIDLPVWRWCFIRNGQQVAFEQETVHGSMGIHYELREIASGRLVEEFEPTSDPDMDPGVTPKEAPAWVKELNAKQR